MINCYELLQEDTAFLDPEMVIAQKIAGFIEDTKKNFVKIALCLQELRKLQPVKYFAADSVISKAEEWFGFKKSTSYALLNIADEFCDDTGLFSEYEGFSQSQLVELSSIKCAYDRSRVTPDMSVEDIRIYKKARFDWHHSYSDRFGNPKKTVEEYKKYHPKAEKVKSVTSIKAATLDGYTKDGNNTSYPDLKKMTFKELGDTVRDFFKAKHLAFKKVQGLFVSTEVVIGELVQKLLATYALYYSKIGGEGSEQTQSVETASAEIVSEAVENV